MPLPALTAPLGKKRAAHLLRRLSFGPRVSDINTFATFTPAQALDALLQPTAEPPPPIDPRTGVTWVNAPSTPANSSDDVLQTCMKSWWIGQMMAVDVPDAQRLAYTTREKIIYFLHTHFTTIQSTVNNSRALYFQNVLFRKFALDSNLPSTYSMKELTKKISMDNAMLILLDGRLNVKGDPNENYARELIELYTIGKGLQGFIPATGTPGDYIYFTEQDVRAAALILTGYDTDTTFTTFDSLTGLPQGKVKVNASAIASQHDSGVKTFSARLNNAVVTPNPALLNGTQPTAASVIDELDQLIEILYQSTETHYSICRKIYRFFVHHEITATIDNTIIAELVQVFNSSNFKLEPVLRHLLASQHFYDSMDATVDNDRFGTIIKSPLELVTETLHFFEYSFPSATTAVTSFYAKQKTIIDSLQDMGHALMNPIDVAGYEAYHQYPLYHRSWISPNALNQRYNFIFRSLRTDTITDPDAISIDVYALVRQYWSTIATDPDLLIRTILSYVFPWYEEGTELTTERIDYFKERFYQLGQAYPQGPLLFWQISWLNAESMPASKMDAQGMLQDLFNAILQSPEFQLH